MNESDEIKVIKIITSNCFRVTEENKDECEHGFVIGDIFELVNELDIYFKKKYRKY
jgi:hypothetical protein